MKPGGVSLASKGKTEGNTCGVGQEQEAAIFLKVTIRPFQYFVTNIFYYMLHILSLCVPTETRSTN